MSGSQEHKMTLGEVLSLEYGKPLPKEKRATSGKYPVFGANGIKCYTSEPFHPRSSIIVGRKGTAGAVNMVEGGFWPLDVTYFVTFDESQYDLKYLYYLLLHVDLPKLATGVKPGINRNNVYAIECRIPLLREQKRIVAILDEAFAGIETAIANTEKNLANAREVFRSCLNETFLDAPDSWALRRLDELCSIRHGFAFKSQYFAENGDYVLLTPGSFWEQGGFRDQGAKTKYYVGEIPKEYLLDRDDFLIAMTEQAKGLLGSSVLVPESDRYLHNQRLGRVVPHDGVHWHNEFFFHQFNTDAFRYAVQFSASGVKVRHTSPKKLGEILVKHPPSIQEQEAVASRLNLMKEEVGKLEHVYARKLNSIGELKQSLLQKAFSGELTADHAEREVESAAV